MSIRTVPVTPVKLDLADSARMAVAAISRFLGMYYPPTLINETQAPQTIAGHWFSRIGKGFHDDTDFLYLTRDFLSYLLSNGERSQISDQLGYYFSDFMPSYGASRIFMDMAYSGRDWSEIQAFMHTLSYGGAQRYIESFDWGRGRQKAQAEIDAWKAALQEQFTRLDSGVNGESVLLAQANPQPAPRAPIYDVPPANEPYMPKPRPNLRVVPPGEPVAPGIASRVLQNLLRLPLLLIPLLIPGDTPKRSDEEQKEFMAEYARQNQLPIPVARENFQAQTDATNSECKQQIEENQKNGSECEENGYEVMDGALHYTALIKPPKGRGLDGLFQKRELLYQPNPMPATVTSPKPGRILFIPNAAKPPQVRYDFAAMEQNKQPIVPIYPKFVVFEAKHIARTFNPNDPEGIQKEAQKRLGRTCDGTQMSEAWTKRRVPQALKREDNGFSLSQRETKRQEIDIAGGYARWIFICLPDQTAGAKIYVFIDVNSSGMDLESQSPKVRKPRTPAPGTGGGAI